MTPKKPLRRWLAWTVAGVWIASALAVLVTIRMHPSTDVNASLSVGQFTFRTNASRVLGPGNAEQLLISGVSSLQIQLNSEQTIKTGGSSLRTTSIDIHGEPSASCSLYHVRSGGLEMAGPSIITLAAPRTGGRTSFSLKVHGPLSANLTSRPNESGLRPGFECTRVHVNGAPAGDAEGRLSPQGGDSIFFSSSPDARIDFDLTSQSEIGDTQIPILGEIRFSEIDPHTSEEKTVLLKPPAGYKNEVSFEKLDKSFTLDDSDLLVVVPKSDFYLRRFIVKDGIQLSLHGAVRDVRAGAGSSGLETQMLSLFDHLEYGKAIFGTITGLVAVILGILKQMGGLSE